MTNPKWEELPSGIKNLLWHYEQMLILPEDLRTQGQLELLIDIQESIQNEGVAQGSSALEMNKKILAKLGEAPPKGDI